MTADLLVYVLFHETNSGHSDESDGYVEAIYATEALAEAAKLAAIRKARDDGEAIYFDPDTEEEFAEDWAHDWHVEPHRVINEESATVDELADKRCSTDDGTRPRGGAEVA